MADISSLYPQAPQQSNALNPLSIIGAVQGINQAQLFNQEFKARNAIGQAYQNAINPKTGEIDTPTLMRGIQSNPDAGFLAGEASQGALARQGQSISNQNAQLDQSQKQIDLLRGIVGPLATKPGVTKNDVINAVVTASRQSPAIPTELLTNWLGSVPNDSRGIQNYVNTTLAQQAGPAGLNRVTGPPVQSGPNAGAQTQMPLAGTIWGNQQQPNSAPGQTVTSLPPGADKSAAVMQDDLARARNFGQEMAPWQQALEASNDLTKKYGEGFFGPGSKGRQDFQSFFFGLSPTLARWAGVDADKLKDYAKADKYLTQAVQSRAASFGAATEQNLATTISGSPNVHVTDLAVPDVIKMSMALRRMEQAQTLRNSDNAVTYTKNAADWATKQDPRAYAIDLLDPAARAKLQKSMPAGSPQRAKFNASVDEAIKSGVLAPPGQRSQNTAPAAPATSVAQQ